MYEGFLKVSIPFFIEINTNFLRWGICQGSVFIVFAGV